MALTPEQETEIINRVSTGQPPPQIISEMGIAKTDFLAFQHANRQGFRDARQTKASRLAKLNRSKGDMEAAKAELDTRISEVDAKIAEVEAE